MELSAWVKSARTHKGLTQTQLGERLHVTKGNVSAWENGHHEPSFGQLQTISHVTGYPLPSSPPPPPSPPADFQDRYIATPSEWALLQDIKDAMEVPMLARKLDELRAEVAELKAFSERHSRRAAESAEASARRATAEDPPAPSDVRPFVQPLTVDAGRIAAPPGYKPPSQTRRVDLGPKKKPEPKKHKESPRGNNPDRRVQKPRNRKPPARGPRNG